MSDSIKKKLNDFRKTAEREGFSVFAGLLPEFEGTVTWNLEHASPLDGPDPSEFLNCAKALGVKVIYCDWNQFEQSDYDDAIESGEADVDEIKEFENHLGEICVVEIAFIANDMKHVYQETTDWWDRFQKFLPEED